MQREMSEEEFHNNTIMDTIQKAEQCTMYIMKARWTMYIHFSQVRKWS